MFTRRSESSVEKRACAETAELFHDPGAGAESKICELPAISINVIPLSFSCEATPVKKSLGKYLSWKSAFS